MKAGYQTGINSFPWAVKYQSIILVAVPLNGDREQTINVNMMNRHLWGSIQPVAYDSYFADKYIKGTSLHCF